MPIRDQEAAILQAIRGIYGAVLDPDEGPQAFASLCRLVAGEHLTFFTKDLHAHRMPFVTAVGVDAHYLERLASAAEAQWFPPNMLTMSAGKVTLGQSLWLKQPWRDSELYNEVVRPDGGFDGLVAVPFRKGRHSTFLVIERMLGQPDFEEADAKLVQTVIPHLANATQIRLRLERAELAAGQAHRAFDLLDLGVFILNAELRPSFLNKYAETLVGETDGLAFNRGSLHAASIDHTKALRRAVKSAVDLQAGRRQTGVEAAGDTVLELKLPRPSGRPSLIATIMPLGVEHSRRLFAPPARAIMFIKKQDEKPRIDPSRLANTLGLSQRQAAITGLLAQGATLAQAAAALGIAADTARWHLRAVFERTDTHRQIDLVRLVLQTLRPRS